MKSFRRLTAVFGALALATPVGVAEAGANPFSRIGHIVVIYTENRSFDNIFGLFPGAEGLASAAAQTPQVDRNGEPLKELPRRIVDDRFPAQFPNKPFALDAYAPSNARTPDPVHDFYQEQEQIDGGKMDRFVEVSNVGALTMGYYNGAKLKQWEIAKEFTLTDHFFHGAFGGSFLNHFFLVCACTPTYPDAPDDLIAVPDGAGRLARAADSPAKAALGAPRWTRSGKVTPDHIAFGKFLPENWLGLSGVRAPRDDLPLQDAPTIGDRLSEKGVSWAWYAGGWNDVVSGKAKPYDPPTLFQTHHQPFLYFKNYGPGSPARAGHLKDSSEFFEAARMGSLPAVSFYKPSGRENEHAGYSDLAAGDAHLADVIAKLRASPNWGDMMIIVTADENGGFWDHVAPPVIDRFGPGTRVPTMVVSPFAKKSFVDHTVYETTSILRTIEARFGLEPLGSRDAAAADLRNSLHSSPE